MVEKSTFVQTPAVGRAQLIAFPTTKRQPIAIKVARQELSAGQIARQNERRLERRLGIPRSVKGGIPRF